MIIILNNKQILNDLQIPRDTHYCKQEMSLELRRDMYGTSYENIKTEKRIFIDLPEQDQHKGHIMGDVSLVLCT